MASRPPPAPGAPSPTGRPRPGGARRTHHGRTGRPGVRRRTHAGAHRDRPAREGAPGGDGREPGRPPTSAEGARLLEEERRSVVSALDDVTADWPEEDVAAFAEYLRGFTSKIERIGGRPRPRP